MAKQLSLAVWNLESNSDKEVQKLNKQISENHEFTEQRLIDLRTLHDT
jgi:hypothetical protein